MNRNATYRVKGWGAVAWTFLGWAQVWEPYTYETEDAETGETFEQESENGEWVDNTERARMCMLGDDSVHVVDPDDCTELAEHEYCHSCGQVGCTADGRELES